MAIFFHCTRFQVENTTRIRRILSRQLLSNFVDVIGMNQVEERRVEEVSLWLIEHRSNWVRYIDDPAIVTRDDEQKAISSLKDEMLQLLVGEEWGLVSFSVDIPSAFLQRAK